MSAETTSAIASAAIGHRAGHAMYAEVRRFGPREWVVSLVCNGMAESSRAYRTKREAMAAFTAYADMRSASSLAAITRGRQLIRGSHPTS